MGDVLRGPVVCALCGRVDDREGNWLKGEAGEDRITLFLATANREFSPSAYDICGEKCASEFVALWVDERCGGGAKRKLPQPATEHNRSRAASAAKD